MRDDDELSDTAALLYTYPENLHAVLPITGRLLAGMCRNALVGA